jgi:hypothetical protein
VHLEFDVVDFVHQGCIYGTDHCCRYPEDTVHGVATKELEYVQGYSDGAAPRQLVHESAPYFSSPGFTPEDKFLSTFPDEAMSPEAKSLIRNPDGSSSEDPNTMGGVV